MKKTYTYFLTLPGPIRKIAEIMAYSVFMISLSQAIDCRGDIPPGECKTPIYSQPLLK
jgi:hypothetical protein